MSAPAPPRFLCIGAAHWDIVGRTRQALGPGADVPGFVSRQPGGVALNIAFGLARLGRPVTLLSAIGRDPAGEELLRAVAAGGVEAGHVHRAAGPTGVYLAIEDAFGDLHAAVADCLALDRAGPAVLAALAAGSIGPLPWTGPIVADGNLGARVLAELDDLAAPGARLALAPPSPVKAKALVPLSRRAGSILYLNRAEAEVVGGAAFKTSRAAATALRALGVSEAVITDGPNPASYAGEAGLVTLPPRETAVGGVTGAGDAFVSAHFSALVDGAAPQAALEAALAAAGDHVAKFRQC